MSAPPVESPPKAPREPKSQASADAVAEQVVSLRERLMQSNKARTQGAGSGQDRELTPDMQRRRNVVWLFVFGFIGAMTLASVRFFFPRVLFEPKTRFSIGYPTDFAPGVDTRFQQEHRIWVVRDAQGVYVLLAKCTHLGCTPDWKETDNKFKCPCHGSGFDMEGVNFEGPAPRPLDRVMVEVDAEGRLIVDKAVLFPYEKWEDTRARVMA
jgi:cytochrome b6-f complex iron-sulfur subunit